VDGELALRQAQAVYALGPKPSGSPGAAATIAFLQREIRNLGLNPRVDEWPEPTADGAVTFRNLEVEVPGRQRDRFILFGCHYDTKRFVTNPDFAGANDGASGVGALLAMLAALTAHSDPPPCALRFVFLDGEECLYEYGERDGLHGSRRHAARIVRESPGACLAAIILDMIGDRDLTITLSADTDPRLLRELSAAAAVSGRSNLLKPYGRNILDDHCPYRDAGIPAMVLIDFEYGPGNRYWHSPADTPDKLSAASLESAAELALALAWRLAATPR